MLARRRAWPDRPRAAALLAALAEPARAFDAVVVGEYERAFSGHQLRQLIPLFTAHGVPVWLPEAQGPLDIFVGLIGIRANHKGTVDTDEERLMPFTHAITPQSTWRQNRRLTGIHLASGVLIGVLGGGIATMMVPLTSSSTVQVIGCALFLGGAWGTVQRQLRGVWLLTVTTLPYLAPSERLPLRLMSFLEDMRKLGLLRAVGPIYQFRHAALHDHLAGSRT